MNKLSSLLSVVVAPMVLAAGPAWAQTVPSLSDGSWSTGVAVEAPSEAQKPQPTGSGEIASETIGDWNLLCATSGPEPRPCNMVQLLQDGAGTPIAEVTLFPLSEPEGEAVAAATFIVPLETLLTSQLTLSVDGEGTRRYPFAFCNETGCVARIALLEEDVARYKGGNTAQVTIVPALAPNQVVNIEMSLTGFTKAYEKSAGLAEE